MSNTSTHSDWREKRVVLVRPADHAQHAKVRAEEQRVSEHAEANTWVSTWTSEQLVETAKTLTQPRPRIATGGASSALAERDRRTRKQRRRGADTARNVKSRNVIS